MAALVHLGGLWIYVNPISNLSPLANLAKLKQLNLGICEISDIRPLANLTRLERLWLHSNQIQDITPLTNLTNLIELWLTGNRIVDIRPLANLTRLEILRIHDNLILDVSPLKSLSISEFLYDEVCELSGLPIQDRVNNRNYLSAFQPWNDIRNRPFLSPQERIAAHDLLISGAWGSKMTSGAWGVEIYFQDTDQGVVLMGGVEQARQQRDELLAVNPNLIFVSGSVHIRDSYVNKPLPPPLFLSR